MTNVTEKFDVKTAKTKFGKITVKSFDSLDDAKKHLDSMKKKGHNGIISKGGKPVKENYEEDHDSALQRMHGWGIERNTLKELVLGILSQSLTNHPNTDSLVAHFDWFKP